MCGIAGIWTTKDFPPDQGPDVGPMTRILAHRGPDEEAIWREGPVQLGVRRLRVIDLVTGSQPMFNEDRSIVVVFNGEIYNFKQLRAELEADHEFRTNSDTEVIVHAYEQWGVDCLQHFNGMFAFALYDGQRLLVARDRIGEKPLYYSLRPEGLFLASEVKSLLTQFQSEPEIDEHFWTFDAAVGERSLFKGIKTLPPAHYLLFDGKRLEERRYWDLLDQGDPIKDEQQAVDELRWLLEDSVKLRMIADVPVGMFLSGGLDSALIACLSGPQLAYSCHFPLGEAFAEIEYARMVARHAKIELVEVTPTPDEMREMLPKIVWNLDMPIATASPLGEFSLARKARERVKVILGGQGADETFGGYVRYLLMNLEHEMSRAPQLSSYHDLARYFWSENTFRDPAHRYFELISRSSTGPGEPRELIERLFSNHTGIVDRMGYADLHVGLPSLLQMNDRAASAYGLENRCPFLDHRIVEFGFRLPNQMKIDGFSTKVLLRKVARGIVPDPVIDRKDKKGLVVPFHRWLTGELSVWARELIESLHARIEPGGREQRGQFDRHSYTLVCLELWFRNFFPDWRFKPSSE
ncbi:MAG: asparagine synthase (glutamine-hydrolyzing) [Candidatus Alcyoniella australis]|nr:asparagine synthase (glutamine-hydrolyzing) [Candidatus Alcyoniella australis]